MNFPDDLSNWIFNVDEVSNGVYQVTAIDKQGRKVEMTGIDEDRLIAECRKAAAEINVKMARMQ